MCPLYEYADPETGVRVELRRPVDDHKPIVLIRDKTVPDRVTIYGFDRLSPRLSMPDSQGTAPQRGAREPGLSVLNSPRGSLKK
jgi:hypothetical protein